MVGPLRLASLAAREVAKHQQTIDPETLLDLPLECRQKILFHYLKHFSGGSIPEHLTSNITNIQTLDLNGKAGVNETIHSLLSSSVTSIKKVVLSSNVSDNGLVSLLDSRIKIEALVLDRCYQFSDFRFCSMCDLQGFKAIKSLSMRYTKISNKFLQAAQRNVPSTRAVMLAQKQGNLASLDALGQLRALDVKGCDMLTNGMIIQFMRETPVIVASYANQL